jgi:hypothetical protein
VERGNNLISPKLASAQARSDASDGSGHRRGSFKHSLDHEPDLHDQQSKRPRTDASPLPETKTSKSDDEEECIWDSIDVPREADRRRKAERDRVGAKRRGSTGSRGSRHSSQSSQSSDLNSLEAELLGRPVRQKSPDKSSSRHRAEPQERIKPKRRPANTNSAYR